VITKKLPDNVAELAMERTIALLADLVVLAEDPIRGDPERIKDIPVLATMVGDKIVYEK